jgi:MFS family permease
MQITGKTGKRAMKKDRRADLRKKMVLPAAMMRSFVMGFKGSITNLFILDIAMEFGRSMSELGGMIAANYIAGVIVPFIAGRVSDLIGKKKVIMISMIIAAAGALMIAFSKSVGVYIIGTIVLGIGNTASNGAITPALADMFPKKATRYISLLHVTISSATMVAPMTLLFLHDRLGVTWRYALIGIAVLTFIPFLMIAMSDIREPEGARPAHGIKEMLALLKDPVLLLGAISLLFYCATDNVYSAFLSIFYNGKFNSALFSSYALTLHGAMYALARFLAGYVKKNTKWLGLITLLISTFALIMVTVVKEPVQAVVFCALYSLSFAPLYSIVISTTALAYPGNSGTATSLMFLGGGLGGMIFSTPASILAGKVGVDWVFYLMASTCATALVLFLLYSRLLEKRNKKDPDAVR